MKAITVSLCCTLGAVCISTRAALAEAPLTVALGQWSFTSQMDVETLKKNLPAKALQVLGPIIAQWQQPHMRQICLTEDALKKGFDVLTRNEKDICAHSILSSSSSTMAMLVSCGIADRAPAAQYLVLNAASLHSVSGHLDVTWMEPTGSHRAAYFVTGKYLGAACKSTKPDSK